MRLPTRLWRGAWLGPAKPSLLYSNGKHHPLVGMQWQHVRILNLLVNKQAASGRYDRIEEA